MSQSNDKASQQLIRYRKIFFLTDDDLSNINTIGNQVLQYEEMVIDEFFAVIEGQPALRAVFPDQALDLLEEQVPTIWHNLALARLDLDFITTQLKIGQTLYHMGIPFEEHLASLIAFHEISEDIFIKKGAADTSVIRSLKKLEGIQICVLIDIYNELTNKLLQEKHEAITSMSTPITNIWRGILFLPLVGIIDAERAQNIITNALQKIATTQSKVFIIDISGVAVVDTAVANYLIKITKAAKLMGCACILAGISAAVAQTIVDLGIQTDEINTTGNMQSALERGFKLLDIKVSDRQHRQH